MLSLRLDKRVVVGLKSALLLTNYNTAISCKTYIEKQKNRLCSCNRLCSRKLSNLPCRHKLEKLSNLTCRHTLEKLSNLTCRHKLEQI